MKLEDLQERLGTAVASAAGNEQLQDALRGFEPLLYELAGVAEDEAKAFFGNALEAVAAGDVQVSNLAYDLRRRVQHETTASGLEEAVRRQRRAEVLSEILAAAGAAGLIALKILAGALL